MNPVLLQRLPDAQRPLGPQHLRPRAVVDIDPQLSEIVADGGRRQRLQQIRYGCVVIHSCNARNGLVLQAQADFDVLRAVSVLGNDDI